MGDENMSMRHYLALRPVLIGMSAWCAVVGGASAQSTVFHADGTSGLTVGSSDNTSIVLNVNRGGSGTTKQTFLSFNLFTSAPNSLTNTFGNGTIPNTDLTGDSTGHLRLGTDTSTNTNFTITSCTFDLTTFINTCSNISGGPIGVTWTKTQGFTAHSTSTQVLRFAQFTQHSVGESESSFALASGSVLDNTLPSGSFGEIGVNHNTTITITRNP
jgi:hypothetical protein